MIERIIGALRLDPHTYEEVEADTSATKQAALIVVMVAIASGIGGLSGGVAGILTPWPGNRNGGSAVCGVIRVFTGVNPSTRPSGRGRPTPRVVRPAGDAKARRRRRGPLPAGAGRQRRGRRSASRLRVSGGG